jgi:hypothetical protein
VTITHVPNTWEDLVAAIVGFVFGWRGFGAG